MDNAYLLVGLLGGFAVVWGLTIVYAYYAFRSIYPKKPKASAGAKVLKFRRPHDTKRG